MTTPARGNGPAESAVAAALRWRRIVAAADEAANDAADLDIVFLCTGNRFRSPLAAALLARSTDGLPVTVRSAGTLDRGSPPVFPETLEHGRRFGLDLSAHRARPLRYEDVRSADAVIGFEQMHVAVAVVDASVPRERAFTLPELVGLLELDHDPGGQSDVVTRARIALERAASARSGGERRRPEVADPVGGTDADFARAADEIRELVGRLADGLFR